MRGISTTNFVRYQLKKAVTAPYNTFRHFLLCLYHALAHLLSASNKARIQDIGGKDILMTLSRSRDEKIRQQASKALANLNPEESIRK